MDTASPSTAQAPTAPGWRRTRPAPPARVVHLGLGAFHRAHQAWYTQRANELAGPDDQWGIAAFTGRSARTAEELAAQDGRYTLVTRSSDGDELAVVDSLAEVHDGADVRAWRDVLSRPRTGVLTLTVTEAGYRRAPGGGIDLEDPDVAADLALLRADAPGTAGPMTAPGRLVDGLRARRRAQAGPIAVVSCDNLPGNGDVTRRVVVGLAEAVDPDLARWIGTTVSFVSSMVDRITPATTDADRAEVRAVTGREDRSPVVTEPFSEWVLQGDFPAGRPAWEHAGARFVPDVEPFERRKLWLLNAGHSLLAYTGLARGRVTVAEAFGDPACRAALEDLWSEAAEVLPFTAEEVAEATEALRRRFANARIEHRLAQIASDGSQKLPIRVLAVAEARRAAGLPVGRAGAAVVAAWVGHLVDREGATTDPSAAPLAVSLSGRPPAAQARTVLEALAPGDPRLATWLAPAVTEALTATALR